MRQKSIDNENFHHSAPIPGASRVGPILATSAVGGHGPDGKLPADIDGQARYAFENLKQLLAGGGMDLGDVVKIGVFVTDEGFRAVINKYWLECFPDAARRPARHTITLPLRGGMLVQIDALAIAKDA